MNAAQTVQAVFSSIDQGKFDDAARLLADDFAFTGATPVPLNAQQWIGVHRAFSAAMPDFKFNYKQVSAEGNRVVGTVEITGTHTGELVLPVPGVPRVPATGRSIDNAKEPVDLTVRDGKITELRVEHVPGGGMAGILSQMGVALPQP